MENSLPYPECFLGSIVNPGEYWLISKLKTHVKDVKILEEMLSEEMNQILTVPDPDLLIPNCCVAVENKSAKGSWQRGKIIEKLAKDKYKIFLVDYGCFSDRQISHLQLVKDKKYLDVEPLSFKLHLYGIVPFIVTEDHKRKVSESWSKLDEEFVSNLFSQRLLIYVKKEVVVNRTIYGDLFLIDKPNGDAFSLTKLLCLKQHGVYAESYFKRKILEANKSSSDRNSLDKNFLSPSCLSTKLDIIKQWQLSTAQYQGGCHEEESSALKSSSEAMSDYENDKDCDVNSRKSDVNISVSRNGSVQEDMLNNPVKTTSSFKVSDNISQRTHSTETLSSDSVKLIGENGSNSLVQKKKTFKVFLESNLKELQIVGNYSNSGIFTLFRDSAVQPVDKFRNLNISENIILNLESEGNFKNLSQIQRWAIPSIRRGHNIVMIGSAKTGKSLSFVISLLAILRDRLDAKEMPIGNGPIAIILCSGSRSCENLYYICHVLLRKSSKKQDNQCDIRVEVVHGNSREQKSWVKLTNGCELLISTPHCLDRLLKYRSITNLERLDYLVLDEVDIITQEPFLSPLKAILHQSKIYQDCQKIFCGEKWTPEVENVVNRFAKNHAVLISSYLEAAIYTKLRPNVILVNSKKKPQIVLDATTDKIGKLKICIVCEYTSEVVHLVDVFKAKGYAPLFAHSKMVLQEIKAVKETWDLMKNVSMIICCDDVMHQLAINDAELLIHYSLPSESKTNFGFRFSTLMKNYKEHSVQMKHEKEHRILILTDDQNHYQLPHVLDFISRAGGKIPDEIQNISQEISWRIEANKKLIPICFNLLEFGQCRKLRNCSRRHAFINEIDSSELYPSGLVKFEVLKVHSVCHLSVRLIEFIDESGNKSEMKNEIVEISDKMREFFRHEENRSFIGEVKVNKLCAVEREDANGKLFERCQIIEFKKFNNLRAVVEVLVKMLDTGELLRVSVYKLYELSEELKNYKAQAFDIFLCNLLPNDYDHSWSEEAVFSAKTLFTKPLQKNQFWIGRIRLSLRNSLHLEPVKLSRYLENVKTYVTDYCVRREFLKQRAAVENENHLEMLRPICEKAGIRIPSYKVIGDKLNEEIMEPQWAFFDGDMMKVHFISAEGASCLFLRLTKFSHLLKNLEKECQKMGNELKKSDKKWIPNVGTYCLALYKKAWNRGRVEHIENNKILVFFIDYGDCHFVDDLVPMPSKLLNQLPAQAIECCLVGLKQEDSSNAELVLDEIYSFSSDGLECLYAVVTGKGRDSVWTGGWKYQVNLLNRNGISLNRKLIDDNIVKPKDDFHLAENVEMAFSEEEQEEDSSAENDYTDMKKTNILVERNPVDPADPSYRVNFSDDVFDEENAQLMLEEFMAHMFPGYATERKEFSYQTLDTSEKENISPEDVKKPEIKKFQKKYKLVDCYTPQLQWRQDHCKIEMKIMLNNVEKYKFECTSTHFIFRCVLSEKLYVASVRLFGAINPELSEVRIKPFHVHILLKKLCPLPWLRLTMDKQKYRWINFDVENYDDEQTDYIKEICKKAVAEIESGQIKHEKVDGEVSFVPSSDSENNSEEESDSEDDNLIFI